MSLPTIKELVDLKDLGKYVQDIKGVFPFVFNEKANTGFEQQWLDVFKDNDFLSKDQQELLVYSDEEQQDPQTVNELLEQNPTEAGEESNYFRKGIEGVYRINAKQDVGNLHNVESHGWGSKSLDSFAELVFAGNGFNSVFEKSLSGIEGHYGDVAVVVGPDAAVDGLAVIEEVPVAVPQFAHVTHNPIVNLPLGHRNIHPQQVMLDEEADQVINEAAVDALLENFDVEPVADQQVVDEVPAVVPVVENTAPEVIDEAAVDALLENFDVEPVADQQVVDEVPAVVPVVENTVPEVVDVAAVDALLVDFDAPAAEADIPSADVTQDDLNALAEAGIQIEEAVDVDAPVDAVARDAEVAPPVLPRDEMLDVATEVPPVVPPRDDEVDNAAVDLLLADMMSAVEPVAAVLPPPPPPMMPAGWKPNQVASRVEGTQSAQATKVEEATKPHMDAGKPEFKIKGADFAEQWAKIKAKGAEKVATDVAPEAESNVNTVAVEKLLEDFDNAEMATDKVDENAVQALLDLGVQQVAVTPGVIPPPPPPPPASAKTKVMSAIEGTQNAPAAREEAVVKPNVNLGKPEFAFKGDDFAQQLAKIKAKAAEKALTEIEVAPVAETKKESSLLIDAFNKAMTKQSSLRFIEEDKNSDDNSGESSWDDEFSVKEKNLDLIQQMVRETSRDFSATEIIESVLNAKAAEVSRIVDAYELKLKTLPIMMKLSAQDQENMVLANGITSACNALQRKIIANANDYAVQSLKLELEQVLHAKLVHDLSVNTLATELTSQHVEDALHNMLRDPEATLVEGGHSLKSVMETTLTQEVDNSLKAASEYLVMGVTPREGPFRGAIDSLNCGFQADKAAVIKIVGQEGLHVEAEAAAPATTESTPGGLGNFLAQMLGGRRKGIDGDDADDHKAEAKETKPVIEASPFGISALKSLIGDKLTGKTADTADADTDNHVDTAAVDEAMALISPVNSGYLTDGSEGHVDTAAVDDAMALLSPLNSGYLSIKSEAGTVDTAAVDAAMALLSPASSTILSTEPIQMADVLAPVSEGGVHNDPAVTSPTVTAQLEIHDPAQGNVFGH